MATRRVGQVSQLLGSYVAIVLIGIITLFPIYWIVSTSIKKPDDVLQFVSPQQLADLWPSVDRYLGKSREFWAWLLERWELRGYIRR